MNEFLKAKAWLRSAVWHGLYDTGEQFGDILDAIETCETSDQLARVEKWVMRIHAAGQTAPETAA